MPVPVVIVDDSRLMRQRLGALLSRIPSVEVVGEADNGADALRVVEEKRPGIVTLDVSMGPDSGLDVLPRLLKADPDLSVVMVTNFPDPSFRFQARRAGAVLFLSKADAPRDMMAAIEGLAERLLSDPSVPNAAER